MKKTIQFNIAGMVFTIEEEAYLKLDSYLRSIQQYFSSYEGSSEIISDIEARIAEKFHEKQKFDNQQVLTLEDVNGLISSMGTVADFEAIQEEEDLRSTPAGSVAGAASSFGPAGIPAGATTPAGTPMPTAPTRWFRDVRRKALGGVLAGISHNLKVDVTWVRIIFLLLFFSLSPITDSGISGFLLIVYLVCWAVFPPNAHLEEDPHIKKFYRNPDQKVVGGVAGGLAAYFGLDVALIRIAFALGILFFGTGLLAYIILWIVSPEATTLTQKMEMKGQPVTLENIETNVKQSLNISPAAPENGLTRLLLFPFRLLSAVISGLGNMLRTLGPVVRIFAGVILILLGLSFLLTVLIGTGVFFGIVSDNEWIHGTNMLSVFTRDLNPWAGFFAFLAFGIPALGVLLAGLSLVTNRRVGSRSQWITGLGIWLIGVIGASAMGASYSMNFARKASTDQTLNFTLPQKAILLDIVPTTSNDDDEDDSSVAKSTSVELQPSFDNRLYLEQHFTAAGRTKEQAEANARAITYRVSQSDSVLQFNRRFMFDATKGFREQRVRNTLYIPENKPFRMTERFADYLLHDEWELKNKYAIREDQISRFTFVMKRDEGIVCLDCPQLSQEERDAFYQSDFDSNDSFIDSDNFERGDGIYKTFTVGNFTKVDAGGAFTVLIKQGSTFKVEAEGERQKDIDDLDLEVSGQELKIRYNDSFMQNRGDMKIYITMPALTAIDFGGAIEAKVIGFNSADDLRVDVRGATELGMDVTVDELTFDASGASKIDLRGKAQKANIDVSGAIELNARRMIIDKATVEASGASTIKFGKVGSLSTNSSGASSVTQE